MSEWLLPVSRYLRFASTSGRSVDARFEALRDAALDGRLAKVVCQVRGPLVDIAAGDHVWLFTTDSDAGVFAVGRARRPTTTKKPTVTVNIDRTRTKVLAADPLPAVSVRRWVPELRQGALPLDVRPRALGALEAWQRERGERDVELLEPLSVTPWRVATRGTLRDSPAADDVLAPIARMLRSQDFALGVAQGGGVGPWLVGRRVRDVVIVAPARLRTGRGRDEALEAFGPLREYRWRVGRVSIDLDLRPCLWLAFSRRPHDAVIAFLEDEDVLVSWHQRGGATELTDRSKHRWYQRLGLR